MAEQLHPLLHGDGKGGRLTGKLLLSTVLGTLGAAQYGYNAGVLNAPQQVITNALNIDKNGWGWSMIVSTFCIAGYIGATFSGGLVDRWGRRAFLVYNSAFFVLSGALFIVAGYITSHNTAAYALMILARFFAGLGSGAASVAVPMYLGELAPAHLRGAFASLNQLGIVVLILVAQLIGVVMSTSSLWSWMLAITGTIGLAGLFSAALMVESPRWLAQHGETERAAHVLMAIRGYGVEAAQAEVADIQADAAEAASSTSEKEPAPSLMSMLRSPLYRAPLLVCIFLQVSQQLSGINAVFYYSTSFFQDAGFQSPTWGTVAAGAVNVVATVLAVYLIERTGRKPLLLWGAGGMMAAAVVLTGTLVAKDAHPSASSALGAASVIFVMLFVVFFEIGLGGIPWMIGGEFFSEGPRATAMSVAAAFNWFANTLVGIFFPYMQSSLHNYSFVPFAAWLAITFVVTLIAVPETRGRTPADIMRYFSKAAAGQLQGAV